jgi:hypothetical protein
MSTFNRKRQIMEHELSAQDEIDIMWQQAMRQSIEEGEMFTRYHFAKLVAAKEREACAKVADEHGFYGVSIAQDIRARGKQAVTLRHGWNKYGQAIEAELKEKNNA